jgi:nucleoside-diphosphate-sugar epimerase
MIGMTTELNNKVYNAVYVVFGAAGAVGSTLVSRLSKQQGAKVVASDVDQADLEKISGSAHVYAANTQDESEVIKSSFPSLQEIDATSANVAYGMCTVAGARSLSDLRGRQVTSHTFAGNENSWESC